MSKQVKLKDVVEIIMGQSPDSSTYNSAGIGHPFFQGKADFGKVYPTARSFCSNPTKIANENDVLISVRAPVGDVNIADQTCCIGRGLAAIRERTGLSNYKFIFYYLQFLKPTLEQQGTGSTFKAINKNNIENIDIPFLPLETQQKIADVLEKAQALIDKRKEQLEKLDELVQSVFYEMFGDPVRNEKNWSIDVLGNLADSRLGKMRDEKRISGNYLKPYIGNSNVRWFSFNLSGLLEMDFNDEELQKYSLNHGDLLICEGGEIGRCAIWKEQMANCYFQKALHRVRVDTTKLVPEYLQYVMWFFSQRNGFKDYSSQSTIAHLTGEKLRKIPIPLPQLSLQKRFAEVVEKIEQQKALMQQSLVEMENNFNSIMQRAFKGELF